MHLLFHWFSRIGPKGTLAAISSTLALSLLTVHAGAASLPAIQANPTTTLPGASVAVSGVNFPSNTDVYIGWDTARVGIVTAGADGSFGAMITVPADATLGLHTIRAKAGLTTASTSVGVALATATPVRTATETPTPRPLATATSMPTATPTPTRPPTSTAAATTTLTPTSSPTGGLAGTASPTRTATATGTPTRTATPSGGTATPTVAAPTATPTGTGRTLVVGAGGYATISAAVAASIAGDTISIHAGTYREEVNVTRTVSLAAFGDGPVWIDGECVRPSAMQILANDVLVRGLGLKRTTSTALLIAGGVARTTVDGNTIQDFNCLDQLAQFNAGIGAWYAGTGQRITNNTITRRVETSGPQAGNGDGIWFKSNTQNQSGGGHYIVGNVITGGYDGIGGEVEDDPHGSFDRDTIIERNVVRNCGDDGIQSDGGNVNVSIRDNTIDECGLGLSFTPNLLGPLYVERNTVSSHTMGILGALACMKVGDGGVGTAYITANVCNIDGSSTNDQGGDGIKQTNSGLAAYVSRSNVIQVTRYVMEFNGTPLPGSSFDLDCLQTTDPLRFINWAGTRYPTLQAFRTATGQELAGRMGPC